MFKESQRDYKGEWAKDSLLDEARLDNEALRIPILHGKWLGFLEDERKEAFKQEKVLDKLKQYRIDWYLGRLTSEEMEKLKWKPCLLRLPKGEVWDRLKSDDVIQKIDENVEAQRSQVRLLEDIMKMIHARQWQINTAVTFAKFVSGVA